MKKKIRIETLLCLLFGHRFTKEICTKIDGDIYSYNYQQYPMCIRCGIKLEKEI